MDQYISANNGSNVVTMKLTDITFLRTAKAIVTLFFLLGGSVALAAPLFEDVTAAAGILYQQHVPRDVGNCVITVDEFTIFCQTDRMTGGAAVGDVDGDGDLDLFVTRLDAPDILFRNKDDGTFEDGSSAAGFNSFNLQSNAAVFADIDNDGDPDLYVTVLGNAGDIVNNRNYLFINDGAGGFSEEAVTRGADITSSNFHRSFSASFGDYDRDGWIDLHVVEWGPASPSHSRLLHNMGPVLPGYFEDVTSAAGASLEGVFGFGTSFTDLDQDGWPDIAVSGDFGTSQLLWNNGDGTFTDGTVAAQVGTDENGMGSTLGDFDGDGFLDWFVTSIYDPHIIPCNPEGCFWAGSGNRLYRYNGSRTFSDVTDIAGVRIGHWGWGAAFFDYDNDADLDLVMTNGVNFPSIPPDDPFNADPMRMWQNPANGTPMTELSASIGITDTASGKGLLVFDYEQDGDLDVFVVNNAGQPKLYRNSGGNDSDWIRVNTVGVASNKEGLGARVTLQQVAGGSIQVREVGTSTHFLGQSERTVHFGLSPGFDPVALVQVVWPSGQVQNLVDVPRNSSLTVVEENCLDPELLVPDLIVNNVSVSDSSLNPGQPFTVYATAYNQCHASSPSTTMRYYRSTDSTISTDDTEIDTDFISGLSPLGSSAQSANVSISAPGSFWIGACADVVAGEPTPNNCSVGIPVSVAPQTICSTGALNLTGADTGSAGFYKSGSSITAGSSFAVEPILDVEFRAATLFALENNFSVQLGASFNAIIDPIVTCVP